VLMNGMRQYILKLYWSFLFFCFEHFTTNQLINSNCFTASVKELLVSVVTNKIYFLNSFSY